ncbi:MAG TPA: sigma-70 family RNA polymerase sigma factor [Gemmataceae bacterium]|nr:sigma-70 family RNA polymerase sigma factor [Gemmataceae bacterium]
MAHLPSDPAGLPGAPPPDDGTPPLPRDAEHSAEAPRSRDEEPPELRLWAGQAQDGSRSAYELLQHAPSVRKKLFSLWCAHRLFDFLSRFYGGDPEAFFADMITHLWFVWRTLKKSGAPKYDPTRRFLPWLYKVAKNKTLQLLRVHWRRLNREVRLTGEEPARDESKDVITEESPAFQKWLKWLTTPLTDRERDVFRMKWLEGKKQKEIAAVLKKDKGTVTRIIQRIKKKLRRRLDEGTPPEDEP